MSAAESAAVPSGRYDDAARRATKRSGRERGCWAYIPAAELVRAGFALTDPPPYCRTWGRRGGSVLVRLYREA